MLHRTASEKKSFNLIFRGTWKPDCFTIIRLWKVHRDAEMLFSFPLEVINVFEKSAQHIQNLKRYSKTLLKINLRKNDEYCL